MLKHSRFSLYIRFLASFSGIMKFQQHLVKFPFFNTLFLGDRATLKFQKNHDGSWHILAIFLKKCENITYICDETLLNFDAGEVQRNVVSRLDSEVQRNFHSSIFKFGSFLPKDVRKSDGSRQELFTCNIHLVAKIGFDTTFDPLSTPRLERVL